MQNKIQHAIFQYLTDYFAEYGIALNFRYDEDLNVLEEFRRSNELRINNQGTYENLIEKITTDDNGTVLHNMGLYNRTPIKRSDVIGNNLNLEVYSQSTVDKTEVEIRDAFYGEVGFNVKILCDNYEVSDIIELLYVANFSNKTSTIKVDYDFGSDSFVGKVNESSLRYLDFDIDVSGLFFMPYYTNEYKLRGIELHLMVIPVDEGIKSQEPRFDVCDKNIPSTSNELTTEEMKWHKGPGHPN